MLATTTTQMTGGDRNLVPDQQNAEPLMESKLLCMLANTR